MGWSKSLWPIFFFSPHSPQAGYDRVDVDQSDGCGSDSERWPLEVTAAIKTEPVLVSAFHGSAVSNPDSAPTPCMDNPFILHLHSRTASGRMRPDELPAPRWGGRTKSFQSSVKRRRGKTVREAKRCLSLVRSIFPHQWDNPTTAPQRSWPDSQEEDSSHQTSYSLDEGEEPVPGAGLEASPGV